MKRRRPSPLGGPLSQQARKAQKQHPDTGKAGRAAAGAEGERAAQGGRAQAPQNSGPAGPQPLAGWQPEKRNIHLLTGAFLCWWVGPRREEPRRRRRHGGGRGPGWAGQSRNNEARGGGAKRRGAPVVPLRWGVGAEGKERGWEEKKAAFLLWKLFVKDSFCEFFGRLSPRKRFTAVRNFFRGERRRSKRP